jgi:hypothetical protein
LTAGAIYQLAGDDDLELLQGVRILHPIFVNAMVDNRGQALLALLKINKYSIADRSSSNSSLLLSQIEPIIVGVNGPPCCVDILKQHGEASCPSFGGLGFGWGKGR